MSLILRNFIVQSLHIYLRLNGTDSGSATVIAIVIPVVVAVVVAIMVVVLAVNVLHQWNKRKK